MEEVTEISDVPKERLNCLLSESLWLWVKQYYTYKLQFWDRIKLKILQ